VQDGEEPDEGNGTVQRPRAQRGAAARCGHRVDRVPDHPGDEKAETPGDHKPQDAQAVHPPLAGQVRTEGA
jgi:hypothetical protein